MPVPAQLESGEPRRRSRAPWIVLAVVLAAIFIVPSIIAVTVTSSPDSSTWAARPWMGWQFAGRVLVEAPTARAASPRRALERATAEFDEPEVQSVELAYVPPGSGITIMALVGPGEEEEVRLDPPRPLVWQVYGRFAEDGSRGTIGLLDFATGTLVWDTRTGQPEPRTVST